MIALVTLLAGALLACALLARFLGSSPITMPWAREPALAGRLLVLGLPLTMLLGAPEPG